MEDRNQLFQRLKEPCVALAQDAVSLSAGHANHAAITNHLEDLKAKLVSSTARSHSALDSKLTEYAFFPIAQLLRESRKLSIRELELCLQSIAILVEKGWRERTHPLLAGQIVILCSTLGEKNPKGLSFSEGTDELQHGAFSCLYHLFCAASGSSDIKKLLTEEANLPQLGHTLSVLLDGIEGGQSAKTQLAAATALDMLVHHVLDVDVQASFLPGIVSKLTKVLTPQTKQRRSPGVLTVCLDILGFLVGNTMCSLGRDVEIGSGHASGHSKTVIDASWQQHAATQLRPAISNILRLRTHARDDVLESLAKFCVIVSHACQPALSVCLRMVLDALVFVAARDNTTTAIFELQSLIAKNTAATTTLQEMLYDWLQSLTRIMQGHDQEVKSAMVRSIGTLYTILAEGGIDVGRIQRTLAFALRDGVIATLSVSKAGQAPLAATNGVQWHDSSIWRTKREGLEYGPGLVVSSGRQDIDKMAELARLMMSTSSASESVAALSRDLWHSRDNTQLATFWLLLTTVQNLVKEGEVDDLVDTGEPSGRSYKRYLEEIYSYSLSTLTDNTDEPRDPRLLALALRGLGLQAKVTGNEFRHELIDALYPVLHTLATPDVQLQRDSITTLNIFTSACGYSSTADLVIENVDYLTNAVALKLNAFDVSPQAPQVLLMMVRLAGPRLLPYLEDTVDSIFAALEDYHGYPLLVELLFKVLSGIAEEGVKAPQLVQQQRLLQNSEGPGSKQWQPTTMHGLAGLLREHAAHARKRPPTEEERDSHPKKPWKSSERNEEVDLLDEDQVETLAGQDMADADPPPPIPKTYNLLHKITELTQHFLPSASPSLRTSLLALIRTTIPAIACHENSLLPLINTLWPEIVSRMDDPEPYTVACAIEVIGLLCQYVGDFMRSRIVQIWPKVTTMISEDAIYAGRPSHGKSSWSLNVQPGSSLVLATSRQELTAIAPVKPSLHSPHSAQHMVRESLLQTTAKIVQYIQLPPELLDDAFGILQEVSIQPEVRSVLQDVNADALWLAELQLAIVSPPPNPTPPVSCSWRFAHFSMPSG